MPYISAIHDVPVIRIRSDAVHAITYLFNLEFLRKHINADAIKKPIQYPISSIEINPKKTSLKNIFNDIAE